MASKITGDFDLKILLNWRFVMIPLKSICLRFARRTMFSSITSVLWNINTTQNLSPKSLNWPKKQEKYSYWHHPWCISSMYFRIPSTVITLNSHPLTIISFPRNDCLLFKALDAKLCYLKPHQLFHLLARQSHSLPLYIRSPTCNLRINLRGLGICL